MPEERCFVCASNEGVFLDIFAAGKNYREIIETCLSIKINKKTIPSTNICHKCVYELDQCSKFVERYKKTHRTEKGKLCKKSGCCSLCMEKGKPGYIFDLFSKNPSDNSKEKLQEIFKLDLVKQGSASLLICLNCRYNLDVLFDLKRVYKYTSCYLENILNGSMTSEQVPKMNTDVVRRNTTMTRMFTRSESKHSSDTDTSTVKIDSELCMPALSSRKSSPQERKCDECNIRIVNGMDMYRYHHTGNTVCKECWMTMDPCEKAKKKIRKLNIKATKTKLCTVFLKDILSKSLESKNKDSEVKNSPKDEIIVLSSDDSNDENDQKTLSIRLSKRKRKCVTENKPVKKVKTITEPQQRRITRSNSVQTINLIDIKDTRMTLSESAEKSESEGKTRGRRAKITAKFLVSTSKSADEKSSKKSRAYLIPPKKRSRSNSISSNSSVESFKPMKTPRLSASLLTVDLSDQKVETDTEDNAPYTCKACDSVFENKIVGKTHELTHTKKLEVVLKKVTMPEFIEVDAVIEREPSTEFDSPELSRDEPLNATGEVTNESTMQDLSDLPEDDTDNNEQICNTEIIMSSTDKRSKGKKDNNKTKKNEEEKTSDEISKNWSIEGDDAVSEGINDNKSDDVENETAKKIDNVTEEKINDEKSSDKTDSNINETAADNNVVEQPIETIKLNTPTDKDIEVSDKSESLEKMDKNKVQKEAVDEIDDKSKNEIENENEDNSENKSTNENVKSPEKNKSPMEENEMEGTSSSEIIINNSGNLGNTINEESNVDSVKDSEHPENENEKADRIISSSEKQKNAEDNSVVLASDENDDKKLSDTDILANNDNEVEISETEKCNEASDRPKNFLEVDANESGNKVNNISNGKINDEVSTTEADIIVENTEADNNFDLENNKSESTEIEKNALTTIEANNIDEFMGVDEIANDGVKNTEQTPSLESGTTENIELLLTVTSDI